MICKDKENNLQITLYRKPTDQQSYLHAKSEHLSTLKNSIAYKPNFEIKSYVFYRGLVQKELRSYETKAFGKKI